MVAIPPSKRNVRRKLSASAAESMRMIHSRFLCIHSKTDMAGSIRLKNHLKTHGSNIRCLIQPSKTLNLKKVERGTDKNTSARFLVQLNDFNGVLSDVLLRLHVAKLLQAALDLSELREQSYL